jgi:Uma2 family endonuclease
MYTLDEIREAIRQLPVEKRLNVEMWLRELDGSPDQASRVREARPVYAAALDPSFMTLEEFFRFEERSPIRHEFINGVVFAMTAPSLSHNRIINNLAFSLRSRLKRGPCEIFTSEVQLAIRPNTNEVVYCPDVIVDCRPDTRDTHRVRDPKLLVEVLSPSTQIIDRREKLQNYRLIDSVEEYVIVAQDECRVVVYPREERWKPRVYAGLDAAVELRSIALTVPLTDLYFDVPTI